jgi:hypothetical protein
LGAGLAALAVFAGAVGFAAAGLLAFAGAAGARVGAAGLAGFGGSRAVDIVATRTRDGRGGTAAAPAGGLAYSRCTGVGVVVGVVGGASEG